MGHPKRKLLGNSYSNHPFSGAMLVSGRVRVATFSTSQVDFCPLFSEPSNDTRFPYFNNIKGCHIVAQMLRRYGKISTYMNGLNSWLNGSVAFLPSLQLDVLEDLDYVSDASVTIWNVYIYMYIHICMYTANILHIINMININNKSILIKLYT